MQEPVFRRDMPVSHFVCILNILFRNFLYRIKIVKINQNKLTKKRLLKDKEKKKTTSGTEDKKEDRMVDVKAQMILSVIYDVRMSTKGYFPILINTSGIIIIEGNIL